MRNGKISKLVGSVAGHALLLSCAAVVAFPFLWMVLSSVRPARLTASPRDVLFATEFAPGNYIDAWRAAPFGRYFVNTFGVGIVVTLGVVVTASLAGYAFAKLDFAGKKPLFWAFLATMMVPFEVLLIPNFVTIHALGWYNTYFALAVPWLANAFAIFLMRQFFMSIPQAYFDAARIDGCGHFRFLLYVAVPLARPAIVTSGIFAFLWSYNSLLWPLVVTEDDAHRVVQVGLSVFMSEQVTQYHLLMAAATMAVLPTIALYMAAQRHFVQSALASGFKG